MFLKATFLGNIQKGRKWPIEMYPNFFDTQMPNPNWKDGVTLTFSIPR
jgi:hypothetical protein